MEPYTKRVTFTVCQLPIYCLCAPNSSLIACSKIMDHGHLRASWHSFELCQQRALERHRGGRGFAFLVAACWFSRLLKQAQLPWGLAPSAWAASPVCSSWGASSFSGIWLLPHQRFLQDLVPAAAGAGGFLHSTTSTKHSSGSPRGHQPPVVTTPWVVL